LGELYQLPASSPKTSRANQTYMYSVVAAVMGYSSYSMTALAWSQ